jgi:hypothetical protein
VPDITVSEAFRILVPLVIVGVFAVRQELRIRRWDPELFRRGIRVFRVERPLGHPVREVPLPTARPGLFGRGTDARRIGPLEVAFLAPELNGSLLRGLLSFNPATNALEVVGRLQWGLSLLLCGGLSLIGDYRFALPCVGLAAWAYVGETRRFRRIMDEAAAELTKAWGV